MNNYTGFKVCIYPKGVRFLASEISVCERVSESYETKAELGTY